MKNGKASSKKLYYLEIRDLQHTPLFVTRGISLREAVRLAALHVFPMDNYQRVYREVVNMQGHFAAAYQAYADSASGFQRVYLLIASVDPLEDWPEFTADNLPPSTPETDAKGVKKGEKLVKRAIASGEIKSKPRK